VGLVTHGSKGRVPVSGNSVITKETIEQGEIKTFIQGLGSIAEEIHLFGCRVAGSDGGKVRSRVRVGDNLNPTDLAFVAGVAESNQGGG